MKEYTNRSQREPILYYCPEDMNEELYISVHFGRILLCVNAMEHFLAKPNSKSTAMGGMTNEKL